MTLSGINLDEREPTIRPQDDLFRHMNQRWADRTQLPEDRARYGAFAVLAEEAEEAVREIITDDGATTPGTDLAKIYDLYNSFMNVQRCDELGITPVASELARALTVESIPELIEASAHLSRHGCPTFIGLGVDTDPGNPKRYVPFIWQGGISLPDESYYREESFAEVRIEFRAHLERMFTLFEVDDAARAADLVLQLEIELAESHWDRASVREIEKTYNLFTLDGLQEQTPNINWRAFLAGLGVNPGACSDIVVSQPDTIVALNKLLIESRLEAWRYWLAWRVIIGRASYLSQEISQAHFEFFGGTLTGALKQRDRWKRAVAFVEGGMGEAVGRVYVERHFNPEAKSQMDELVKWLIEAYRQSLQNLDWMGDRTRAAALEKLSKFTPKIGHPVKWRDYSTLEVDAHDLVGNARNIAAFENQVEFGKLGRSVDPQEWFMTPQTVNAYYNPGLNEIVFPAAILQPPFFDPNREAAANFGAIGAVIGHEIGHGFDDQGSRYDGDGSLNNWWSEADRAAFESRTHALIEQYNQLSPEGAQGFSVNGQLTLGENIGDLGGLGIAWQAYLLSLGGEEPPVIDGLTGAQRFLLSWAYAWQQKARPEEVKRLLSIDPHSPNEFRCNQIVRNLQVFYDAFDLKPSDKLWLDPAQRVTIW